MDYKKSTLAIIVLCVLIPFILMSGCSTQHIPVDRSANVPLSHIIEKVPFVKQKPYYCGPASAEMVLRYHGITKFDQDDIAQCDRENRKGTHWKKLVDFLNWNGRKDGIVAKAMYGDINLLKKYIASGHPLLVRQWKNVNKKSKHYRVVIGYDEQNQKVIYHDPNRRAHMKMNYKKFNDLWDIQTERTHWSSRNLMIVISKLARNE